MHSLSKQLCWHVENSEIELLLHHSSEVGSMSNQTLSWVKMSYLPANGKHYYVTGFETNS